MLATSLFAAMSATPVFASNLDTAAGMNAVRYETKDASESGENDQNSLFDTLVERQEAAEAELEKVRAAADTAADAAEEAADAARNYAEETEGQEIEEAAEAAALHADNAREASDLAAAADDSCCKRKSPCFGGISRNVHADRILQLRSMQRLGGKSDRKRCHADIRTHGRHGRC